MAARRRQQRVARGRRGTTRAFFGNGSYALDSNTMVTARDDHQWSTFFFRIQQASDDGGRTWTDELWLLTPGSFGEVCYRLSGWRHQALA